MKDWTLKYADEIKTFMERCFYREVTETEKELIFSRKLELSCVPHGKVSSDVVSIRIDKKRASVKKEVVDEKTGHIYPIPFDFDDLKRLHNFFENIGVS